VATPFQVVTVLVVDDVQFARRVAARILSEEGYRVLEADGAEEALEVLSEARGRVDLVLLDIVMPRIDGVALTAAIQTDWPAQRFLYMSAHPAETMARHGLKNLDVLFVAKPFTRAELVKKVEAALRRPAAPGGVRHAFVDRRKSPRLPSK
jgi:two-component system, cell cycle sensor histidine kinase and response regulator CckA